MVTLSDVQNDPVFAFLTYPFATDAEYQQGIADITESGILDGKSEEEKADLLRRSQIFYFNRKTGLSITADDIQRREILHEVNPSAQATAVQDAVPPYREELQTSVCDSESRTLSFAELKTLIERGETDKIPNNFVVPNELNKAVPSESKAFMRRKPWEIDQVTQE